MKNINTAPSKMKALLILCIVGTVISIGITFWMYSYTRDAAQSLGRDAAPSIVAAQQIKATLADAHSNAMNAMVTKEKLGGKFWSLYRKDMNSLHSQLIDASKNMTYIDEERIPLLTILSNISAYEYTVGGAVSSGAEISVDQFMEANRLMQQKILPASSALNKVNINHLDENYNAYTKNIGKVMMLMYMVGLLFLVILIGTQLYLFKKTHRIFNVGLLASTVLFLATMIYSTSSLNSVKADLNRAKHDAFDSIDALWNAKAVAYNANALESLYLLHEGTGIVQTADTINFNLSAARLCSDSKAVQNGGKFEGYLKDELSNITYTGEAAAASDALQQWVKYVEIDKQIRNLEYDSKHKDAIALSIGDTGGQSNYEFAKFDTALSSAIAINQTNFDSIINSIFKTLNTLPYVLLALFVLIIASCIIGMKLRIDEYRR